MNKTISIALALSLVFSIWINIEQTIKFNDQACISLSNTYMCTRSMLPLIDNKKEWDIMTTNIIQMTSCCPVPDKADNLKLLNALNHISSLDFDDPNRESEIDAFLKMTFIFNSSDNTFSLEKVE